MLFSGLSKLWLLLLTSYIEINGQDSLWDIPIGEPGLNSKVEDCVSFETEAGDFVKISPSSKYLMFRGNSNEGWTGDESVDVCSLVKYLEQAEVTNTFDLESLEKHLLEEVWIGMNHKRTPGLFVDARGNPVKFQSFIGMEPDNIEMAERCVLLRPTVGDFLAMEDASCSSVRAGALCQFKRRSSCFLQSAEEIASSSAKMNAQVVNLAVGSRFFVSTEQKPWRVASEVCETNGLQLIILDDDEMNQDLADQIKKRLTEQHLHPATQFWTAGSFQENVDYSATRLNWFIGEEGTIPAVNLVSHTWARATPDTLEPFDQTGSDMETCLDISFENIELESTGSYSPYWRASNCFIPKFFICIRNPPVVPAEVIQNIIAKAGNDTVNELEGRGESGEEIQSCGDLHVDPINFEIDITRPQTEEDIIKFLVFNIEHDLKSGIVPYAVKEELKWKETVIDLFIQIAQNSVDSIYVDHGLLNVVKIIILMYYNALPISANTTKNEQLWKDVYIKHLEECLNVVKTLPVTGNGFEIAYFTTESGDIIDIEVPEENADMIQNLDSSIDILWYLFSFSVASCYNLPKDKLTFASDFHVLFIADFIYELRQKWTINVETAESTQSLGLDYSLALGDFDFIQSFRNLRYLVTAAYMKSNIGDLQLVRPIDMTTISSELPMAQENAKTGNKLN